MRLEGKVAIVTGGGSGIGRATAELFAREGAAVLVVGQTAGKCDEVVTAITAQGGRAVAVTADVSVASEVEGFVRQAVATFGRLDVLFNNAGISHDSVVTDLPEDEWERVIDVDLKSVYLGCRYAIPVMQAQGGGTIVNTASTAGMVGFARRAAYCAAKGGVIALTRALAVEWAPHNIRVNAICPGSTDTPLVRRSYTRQADPEAARLAHVGRQPIGRLSTPEDIARGVLFLSEDGSPTATGSCLVIDGGYTAL